jgi:hypothetical protein
VSVCHERDDVDLQAPAPADWPARFRKAADVAPVGTAQELRLIAARLERQRPDLVEAIGRALLGEAP